MVTLAAIILACSLNQDVTVTWFFDLDGCKACHQHQLELMDEWVRHGDAVRLIGGEEDRGMISRMIGERFPKVTVTVLNHPENGARPGTGFKVSDRFSGELISYFAPSGTYNQSRAKAVLSILRGP